MSLSDTILSHTVGIAFRAVTGNVDPWTLNEIKADTAAGIAQASGPDADPATVAVAQAQASASIDSNLIAQDAHPSQAGVRLPYFGVVGSAEFLKKLEHVVYATLAVAAVGSVAYFALKYKNTFKSLVK